MTPEELKLRETFDQCYKDMHNSSNYTWEDLAMNVAKSDAAKEYHTKGMFTKDDIIEYAKLALQNNGNKSISASFEWAEQNIQWFEQNKKK